MSKQLSKSVARNAAAQAEVERLLRAISKALSTR
jgi:hypothetical protein